MVLEDQRQMLIVHAAALVTAMYAFFISRIRMGQLSRPSITYAPMSVVDEERQKNLDKIYNCNDVECVNMLRMRRAPFFQLCNLLRGKNLLRMRILTLLCMMLSCSCPTSLMKHCWLPTAICLTTRLMVLHLSRWMTLTVFCGSGATWPSTTTCRGWSSTSGWSIFYAVSLLIRWWLLLCS